MSTLDCSRVALLQSRCSKATLLQTWHPRLAPANPAPPAGARAPQRTGTISGAPIRAASAVSSSGIRWLSRSASTRLT